MRLLYSSSLRRDFFFFSESHWGSVFPELTLYTLTPRDSVTCPVRHAGQPTAGSAPHGRHRRTWPLEPAKLARARKLMPCSGCNLHRRHGCSARGPSRVTQLCAMARPTSRASTDMLAIRARLRDPMFSFRSLRHRPGKWGGVRSDGLEARRPRGKAGAFLPRIQRQPIPARMHADLVWRMWCERCRARAAVPSGRGARRGVRGRAPGFRRGTKGSSDDLSDMLTAISPREDPQADCREGHFPTPSLKALLHPHPFHPQAAFDARPVPYHVVPSFLTSQHPPHPHDVALVTQGSVDRLDRLR